MSGSAYAIVAEVLDAGASVTTANGKARVCGPVSRPLKEKTLRYREQIRKALLSHSVGDWSYKLLRIPSQRTPGRVDIWVSGSRLDQAGEHVVWFAGEEEAER